jgi:hypothetical protein
MALFLSSARNEASENSCKISLLAERHIESYRIWMFALLRDRPTLSERVHMGACEQCGSAFNASIGVTTLDRPETGTLPSTGGNSRKGDHASRAA